MHFGKGSPLERLAGGGLGWKVVAGQLVRPAGITNMISVSVRQARGRAVGEGLGVAGCGLLWLRIHAVAGEAVAFPGCINCRE